LGKRGSLADRRLLLSRIPNKLTVAKVFSDLAPRFKDRNGGYTRIYRMNRRPGDNAEMALIEFLDAKIGLKVNPETTKKAKKAEKALAAGDKEAKAKQKLERKEKKKAAKVAKATASATGGKKEAKASKPKSTSGGGNQRRPKKKV
jgi:large subunit ribosomal protein L17